MRLLILDGDRATEVEVVVDSGALLLDHSAVLAATGWQVQPHGLCRAPTGGAGA